MSKKVAITSEFFGKFSNEAFNILEENGLEVIPNRYDKYLDKEEEIISLTKDANAVICDLEKISKNVIDQSPNLEIIARRGVGTDSVAVEYAEEKGIKVARTLGVVEKPVAELVMSYILNISRQIMPLNKSMHQGNWNKILAHSIDGKKLGIIGMGNIGEEITRKAQAFDMEIIYYDVDRKKSLEEELGIEYQELDQLFENADVITLHVPLNEHTENLIDYEAMSKMTKSPILINTARGPVVNNEDLKRALEEGLISYAAVDVFDEEPKTNSVLKDTENVILTPHVGTFTEEIFIKMDVLAAKNVVEYLKR
ncbi:D-3-phosphoglycerate dehydrogenase [Halanaerobium saccharolyticum]|uniref:D-3-phosphoglycerate dehydrogenase n=1 Tax=Halanaerobium saccharolyticum TaxID=43595 RepID=A0A4R7Z716_9FIRM|nr:phosphoglycerate dehydrogenase [Halanaerobium saccharolyticum]RAK09735.1 D-3-phosphoglycerate dehydrogenase [Halanaerobium saccharolyticum]TDW07297.1 D-3-phosphoglycerate dehydrogenase [Halanaerobium saccharolyticum]TDX61176.1 D-3-phosphoglycerate dehydrogenase [Halanaerobium saccharolyticum]